MVDVEISDNVCLDNGCGVLLAERNRLENCTAFRNRVIDADDQHSSLLDAPESSTTTIEGFRATKNRITVIRIRKGVLPMEGGTCTFRSIRGYVRPGKHRLTVEFGEKAIAAIGITVRVRDYAVGETASSAGFCEPCSGTTYNFNPSSDECQPCPENGNCESRVITPDDGYWQKTPCSDQLLRCMPSHACEFKGRSEGLKNLTRDMTSCELDEERRTEYSQAQCAKVPVGSLLCASRAVWVWLKGHEGPLCGSCSSGYSSGLSSKCRRCLRGVFNVAFVLLSVLFLMGLTGVTVNGTLNVEKRGARRLRRQTTLRLSNVLHSHHPPPEGQDLGENTDESSQRRDSLDDESNDGVAASETLLAKWKAVEMFKVQSQWS